MLKVIYENKSLDISNLNIQSSVYTNLTGKLVILLLLLGLERVPPLAQYFTDGPVVLIRVPLVNQLAVTF